jgi:hypothetical protein
MDESLSERLARVDALIAKTQGQPQDSGSLASVPVESLRQTVEDRSRPSAERLAAFSALSDRLRGEGELSEIVLTMIDDPDEELALNAIREAPPFDARVIDRLRCLLDDPRPALWQASASALSRKKDHSLLPRMLDWARNGDADHRRAGLSAVAFLLIPEEHLAVVEEICEDGPRDEHDELVLIEALRVAEGRVAFWRKALGGESKG